MQMTLLKHRWLRWLFYIIAALLILAGIAISIAPATIQWLAADWLEQQGFTGTPGKLNIDLDDGLIEIQNLHIQHPDNGGLELDLLRIEFHWKPLLDNTLVIDNVLLRNLKLDGITTDGVFTAIAGFSLAAEQAAETAIENNIPKSRHIEIRQLVLDTIKFCSRENNPQSTTTTLMNNSCGSLQQFNWQGNIAISLSPANSDKNMHLDMNGDIQLANFNIRPLESESVLTTLNLLQLHRIHVSNHAVPTADWKIELGNSRLEAVKVCNPIAVPESQQVASESMDELINSGCASLQHLDWTGHIDLNLITGHQPDINFDGNLELSSARLFTQAASRDLLTFDNFSINEAHARNSQHYSAAEIQLDALKLLQTHSETEQYVLQLKSLMVSEAEYLRDTSQRLSIKSIGLSGMDIFLEQSAEQKLTGIPVSSSKNAVSDKQSSPATDDEQFNIRIDEITVNGSSHAMLIDASLHPAVKLDVSDIQLELLRLDSSDSTLSSNVNASLRIGDHGSLSTSGEIALFASRPHLNLHQEIKGFDLITIESYVKKFIGHKVHHGQLDLQHDLVIDQGQITVEPSIVLRKLRIEALDSEQARQYKSELGIPLSAALNLLRDSDDNIRLKFPITGDIESPDFSLNDVFAKVAGKAIKEAIINYYTPYGLVKLGGAIFNLATALRFDPIIFTAGKTELDGTAINELNKLAQVMQERPRIDLIICSSPSIQDSLALFGPAQTSGASEDLPAELSAEQLLSLSELMNQRKKEVKKYLVEQLQIDAQRLIICNEADEPDWPKRPDLAPVVTLSL
ncbi:MAG: DUF748 domain-containing protein [Gammaproteobacteria bacterium]|nr:MAG: DUF748 domain-containing protein [Gammaproteobacteria bacterium]